MPESFAREHAINVTPESEEIGGSPEQEEAIILQASLKLFACQGYLNTSMGDIRQTAGVNSRTLYRHFKTKEVIFERLYSSILSNLECSFSCLGEETKKASDSLYSVVEFFFYLANKTPETVQFIFQVNHHHILPTKKALYESEAFDNLRIFIKKGIEQGEIKKLDIDLNYALFFGPVFQCVQMVANQQISVNSIDRIIGQAWQSAWRAVAMQTANIS